MQVLPNVILNYSVKSQAVRLDFTGKSVVAKLNALYDDEAQVFVMEDGSTPFIDETNTNEFKPE